MLRASRRTAASASRRAWADWSAPCRSPHLGGSPQTAQQTTALWNQDARAVPVSWQPPHHHQCAASMPLRPCSASATAVPRPVLQLSAPSSHLPVSNNAIESLALPFTARYASSRSSTSPLSSKVAQQIGDRARKRQQGRLWSLAIGGTAVAGFVIVALNTFQENLMFYITPTEAVHRFESEPAKNRFRLGGLVLEGSVRKFVNSTEMEFVITDLETDILVRYRGALPDLFREGHSIVAEGFIRPLVPEGDGAPAAGATAQQQGGATAPSLRTRRDPGAAPAPRGGGYVPTASGPSSSQAVGTIPARPGGLGAASLAGEASSLDSATEDVTVKARATGVMFTAMEVLAKHDEKYMPKEVAAVIAENKAKQEQEAAAGTGGEGAAALAQPLSKAGAAPPPFQGPRGKEGKKAKLGVAHTPAESQGYEITSTS